MHWTIARYVSEAERRYLSEAEGCRNKKGKLFNIDFSILKIFASNFSFFP